MIKLSFFLSCVLAYHFVDFSATPGNLASFFRHEPITLPTLYTNFTFYRKLYGALPIYTNIVFDLAPMRHDLMYLDLELQFK
jgi:hypothetical protein